MSQTVSPSTSRCYGLARVSHAKHSTRARPAPGHKNETWKARPSGSSSRPPSGQRAFGLNGGDLGGQQFVVHGDLAHLGFQSGDFILAIVALAFLQG